MIEMTEHMKTWAVTGHRDLGYVVIHLIQVTPMTSAQEHIPLLLSTTLNNYINPFDSSSNRFIHS